MHYIASKVNITFARRFYNLCRRFYKKKKMNRTFWLLKAISVLFVLICSSCEKAVFDDEEIAQEEVTSNAKIKGNLILRISELGLQSFQIITKASTEEVPTHICFAIYDMAGTRIKQINQQSGAADFGSSFSMTDFGHVSFQLPEGTYQLVALAHSSTKNPTMTNLSKIQFSNATGFTDTYLYYTTLTVTDEPLDLDLRLDRICALCRFVISDSIPYGVTQIKFLYKGGSSHFSALTGLGVTNSTQTVTTQVHAGQSRMFFDLYTFLHQEEGSIELTATALDASGTEQCAWEFQIPMAQNQITWFTGNFFVDEDAPGQWRVTPNIALDKRWAREVFYTY